MLWLSYFGWGWNEDKTALGPVLGMELNDTNNEFTLRMSLSMNYELHPTIY